MENLKIKLNNESEAEEVKRLAVKAGYKLDALFSKWSAEFCYLVLCKDMSAGFANEIMADGDKPVSIGELRAMANPVKEYLDQNCNYEFVLSNKKYDGFIEIPEGAEIAIKFKYDPDEFGVIFYKNNGKSCMGESDNNWQHDSEWTMDELLNENYHDGGIDLSHEILWQREQDEPFLTPECTLNDQYAEIEQVRQVEIYGTVKAGPDLNFGAAQASGGVDATLTERQSQYGCYEDVAHVTQQILSALRVGNYDELPAPMKESLHMIASKMARIVNGDPEYLDNWHDIGGYSKLIEKLIKGE